MSESQREERQDFDEAIARHPRLADRKKQKLLADLRSIDRTEKNIESLKAHRAALFR